MFGITSARSFFEKARSDFARVEADIADPVAAMNCILSLYHLHEWVWARWLKGRHEVQTGLGIGNSKGAFVAWLDQNCPHFTLLQELTNGTKHCAPVHSSTGCVAGWGRGPYDIGPYDAPYLLIDMGDEGLPDDERYLIARTVLRDIMDFWAGFFATHGITDDAEAS